MNTQENTNDNEEFIGKSRRGYRDGRSKVHMGIRLDRNIHDWLNAQPGPKIDIIETALRMMMLAKK